MELSPSAANGLRRAPRRRSGSRASTPAEPIRTNSTPAEPSCPDASKVGLVHIKTPLLANELEGLGVPGVAGAERGTGQNPFDSLVALYLVAEDPVSGVLVKLAGEGQLDERHAAGLDDVPQHAAGPFEDLQAGTVRRPAGVCHDAAAVRQLRDRGAFTPWSGAGPLSVSSRRRLPGRVAASTVAACPAVRCRSARGSSAQSTNPQAGAFTSFTLELTRPDGDQALSGLTMHLPPGVAALLSSVELCSEAQAAAERVPGLERNRRRDGDRRASGQNPTCRKAGSVFITGPYERRAVRP